MRRADGVGGKSLDVILDRERMRRVGCMRLRGECLESTSPRNPRYIERSPAVSMT